MSYSNYWLTVINVVLNVISGFWMAYRIKSENAEKEDKEAEEKTDPEKGSKVEIQIPAEDSRQWCLFNLCMVFNALYLAMMASAWYFGDFTVRPTLVREFVSNWTLWIYVASIAIGYLLFMYILLAPFLNTNRTY